MQYGPYKEKLRKRNW